MNENTEGQDGFTGQQGISSATSAFNANDFHIDQKLSLVRTITIAKVTAIHDGGLDSPGTVDVHPLVTLINGIGGATPHETVYGLAVWRLQSGAGAIVCNPAVGDVGLVLVCDRDITAVKNTKAESNPSSFRRFSLSDGIYLGGILNGTPDQRVRFTSDGIEIDDKNGNKIVMGASGVNINGVVIDQSGNVVGPGAATFNGHTVGAHTHGGVQPGGGTSGPPTG